jgi:hypothetical protein
VAPVAVEDFKPVYPEPFSRFFFSKFAEPEM